MSERVRPKNGTVGLYVDLGRDHARSIAVATAETIRRAGFEIALCEDQDRVLGLSNSGATVRSAILLVTIGGDGTLLRAAQIAAPLGIPLLGINTGRLGFLTEMEDGDVAEGLSGVFRDGFCIDERTALTAEVHDRTHMALNDIVVRRTANSHMTPFGLFVNGREAAHVPADGIVVATPTGSTAYSLSAGGSIVSPDVAAFTIVALLPHTLFSRPLVVPNTSTIVLLSDREGAGVMLEADGRAVDEIEPGDRVTVTRYPLPVRFARRSPLDFFSVLEAKLRWNAPIKERPQ